LASRCLEAIFNGLGLWTCGLGPGLGLDLEGCVYNFLASPSDARKIIKLITVIITN